MQGILKAIENFVFSFRRAIMVLFAIATVVLAWQATHLKIDAGFAKLLPTSHPYIQTYLKYEKQFGGGNTLLIALQQNNGDIFNQKFFETLKKATDEVFFLPGVDRSRVSSLFTPDTRFAEVVEDGFSGGPVVGQDFRPTPEGFAKVRANIFKSGTLGRLISEDFSSAVISVKLLEIDPRTGQKLDYISFGKQLEAKIRDQFQTPEITVHMIGFAKAVSDIAEGAESVVLFFAITVVITAFLLYWVSKSLWLTMAPLLCSLMAVIWQMGLLVLFGFGIDPLSVLIPFLILAIGVSHGVQMILSTGQILSTGVDPVTAARTSFMRLFTPGFVALVTTVVSFLTIVAIDIPVIQELAKTATIGLAVLALTNLILLPILLCYSRLSANYHAKASKAVESRDVFWHALAVMIKPKWAITIAAVAVVITIVGGLQSRYLVIGDADAGQPELWPSSRFNQDVAFFTKKFSVGVDQMQVIATGPDNACVTADLIRYIDDFDYYIRGLPGVRRTAFLSEYMKRANAGWNEGNIRWEQLPRDPRVLGRTTLTIDVSTGLLNNNCSVMPLYIFLTDHRAETLSRVVQATRDFEKAHPNAGIKLNLASGNAGIMAATNEAVAAAEIPMLIFVYAIVVVICLVTFRSIRATLCIVIPLAIVSILANAMMALLGIGLKVSTLPVTALGVGIGVDYGIYKFSRLSHYMGQGMSLQQAYLQTLRETGSAVIFTGLTLSVGVATWVFSPLKFQADMGTLLTFMFLMNMVGAIILLPAIIGILQMMFPQSQEALAQQRAKGLIHHA